MKSAAPPLKESAVMKSTRHDDRQLPLPGLDTPSVRKPAPVMNTSDLPPSWRPKPKPPKRRRFKHLMVRDGSA
jgi:hypothetical protein